MRRGREPGSERAGSGQAGRDRWLLSYSDFMTLLLALFVVLYASARVDADKQSPFEGLQAAFFFESSSPAPLPSTPVNSPDEPVAKRALVPPTRLERLEEDLERELESQRERLGEELGTSLYTSERGLVLSLASAEFFPAGGVEIPLERREVLAALAPLLAANALPLHFEGHTDDQPIESGVFPSNWELSAARAAAVARLFIDDHEIDPRRVATAGYAEFRPLAPNDEPGNRARNRRVEIVILQDGELVPSEADAGGRGELDRLLEKLPPLPAEADESLRAPDLGPPPEDIPLP